MEKDLKAKLDELDVQIALLPEAGPIRNRLLKQRYEIVNEIRDALRLSAMSVCTVPDCINHGTETHEGQLWCVAHKP